MKIKIGESWGTARTADLARMRQARAAIGDDAEPVSSTRTAATPRSRPSGSWDAADDLDVELVRGAGLLRRPGRAAATSATPSTPTSLPASTGTTSFYFAACAQAGAVDCLQVDASRCGGITDWLRAAAVAAAHGLEVSGHCAPHLHAHVAAATPNLRHLEWFHDHVRIESMFFDGVLDPRGGTIAPDSAAAGHGLTLRRADIDKFRKGAGA